MKREVKQAKSNILIIALICVLTYSIYFFLDTCYKISIIERLIISGISFGLFIFFARKGLSYFFLFALTGIVIFIGLSIAFGTPFNPGDFADQKITPFRIGVVLGAWPTFIITLLFSLGIIYAYKKLKHCDKYPFLLFIVYLVFMVLMAINAKYYDDWKSENYLIIPFLIIIYITHKWFKLSKISYSMIFIFMILHIAGSHYTYSAVPLGEWMKTFFSLERNHYDRIVHFSFGLLLAYPMREMFERIANTRGFWGFWIPVELVLALSCIFEILEWGVVLVFGGKIGVEYLGMQGDMWDAQKDMLLAGIGSIVTMTAVALFTIYYDKKSFFKEFWESLRIKSKKPLGEVAIEGMLKRSSK
jgi:putative membrane protein